MSNAGKFFESDVRESVKEVENLSLYRLYDTMGGRAGIKNISDFIAYKFPHEYYLELKSTKEQRMNFNYISKNQYDGLLEKSRIEGIYAGVLINFRGVERTYFVDITTIAEMKDAGAKSISWQEAESVGVRLEGVKKRVKFKYDVEKLLTDIPKEVGKPWLKVPMKENYEASEEI